MKKSEVDNKALTRAAFALLLIVLAIGATGVMLSRKTVATVDYNYLLEPINRDNEEDIQQRRNERDQANRDAQAAHEKVNALLSEKDNLSGELAELNGLSEAQREQYEIISAQYAAALDAKTVALDTYVTAQDTLADTQERFKQRVSIMFEYQDKSYLEILLESDSIAGFFTNLEMISLITESDNQAIQELKTARDDAELQANLALREAEDMEHIAEEKLAQLEELESRIGVTEAALEDISTDIAYWEQREDDLERYSQSLDKQIEDLQRQRTQVPPTTTTKTPEATTPQPSNGGSDPAPTTAKPTATPVPTTAPPASSNGSLSWPTWNHTITSYYGYRTHPVYGTTKFHSGIDIGAWYGDTIMAAAGGTVIYVETPVPGQDTGGSGYGNYCIIDHGNGVSTLYAHARSISVSTGQTVSAGQAIGVVGSTGTSTAAHLHFEVRIWGSNTDPLGYLK
ncbi:MAG: peptidoglycan DD-metalloendopeptidase family protein [Saccharofermentans sp.]|nr:peptidoglycan DD-metalloendopeptidase family protein [Saccharofermentans sp.]